MSHVQKLINGISDLNLMPRVASRILTLVEDPEASMASLAELVLFDPPITALVLKTCNSAYFGLPRRAGTLVLRRGADVNAYQGRRSPGNHRRLRRLHGSGRTVAAGGVGGPDRKVRPLPPPPAGDRAASPAQRKTGNERRH